MIGLSKPDHCRSMTQPHLFAPPSMDSFLMERDNVQGKYLKMTVGFIKAVWSNLKTSCFAPDT